MRTLYIALIFVGCLSLALGNDPVVPGPYPQREAPEACASAAATPKGCSKCRAKQGSTTEFECETAADGYYLEGNTAKACPQSCGTCLDAKACKTCRDPTFWKDQPGPCLECNAGYTLDISGPNTDLKGNCISVSGEKYTCATNFQWDSPSNPNRKCVANDTLCSTSYSSTQDGTGTKTNGTGCSFCAKDTPTNVTTQGKTSDGILYWNYQCVKVTDATIREVVQCSGTTPTKSCKNCTGAGKCSEAEDGYYVDQSGRRMRNLAEGDIVPGQVDACPNQCKTCKTKTECTTCNTGLTKDDTKKICNCDAGTPSIDASLIITGADVNYTCITQNSGQQCYSGNVWNTPYAPIAMDSKCVKPTGNSPCYTDSRTAEITAQPAFSLTSYWSQTVNPLRSCILASTGKCPENYAPATPNEAGKPLVADCTQCASGATISGNGTDLTCIKNTSSFLVMSLAFLGVLLALVF